MKAKLLVLVLIALVTVGALAAALQLVPPKLNTRELMQAKLAASQEILAGIATENFPLILRSAEKLDLYSRAAGWDARQTPEYRTFTEEFRRHAAALSKHARSRNVDGVTVAWFQLTVSCVNCHKYLRGDKVAGAIPHSATALAATLGR